MTTIANPFSIQKISEPSTYPSERVRLFRHFKSVEQRLKTYYNRTTQGILDLHRTRHLDNLHDYWVQGEFPRNYDRPHQPVPCFIDRDGRVCAVAHLLIASGYSELAHQIANQANNAYITEMAFPALNEWVAQSGLTLSELALIQPSYYFCEVPAAYINSRPPIVQYADSYVNSKTLRDNRIRFPLSPAMKQAVIDRRESQQRALVRGQGCLTPVTPPIQAVTVSEYPTVFIYVGKPSSNSLCQKAQIVEFELWDDEQDLQIYSTTVVPPDTSGIVSVSLPKNGSSQPLMVGKRYRWDFNLVCDPIDRMKDYRAGGEIQRIELNPSLKKQLEESSLLEKAIVYAKAGIWYDTLATLAELRSSQPNDSTLAAEWEDLLRSVGLNDIAREPLIKCCQSNN